MKFEQHRYRVLDCWRGIFALCVACFHIRNTVNSHLYEWRFIHNSYLFVDFFFVLSGFVIFANYERKLNDGYPLWKFMLLRFGRVYPLHLFTLLMVAIFCFPPFSGFVPAGTFDGEMHYFPSQLFLLHSFGIDDRLSFNRASWAVSAEFWSYALFAVLILTFRRRVGLILMFIAAGTAYYLQSRESYLAGTYDYGFLRCVYSFAIGALLWRFYRRIEAAVAPVALRRKTLFMILEILVVLVTLLAVIKGKGDFIMALPILYASLIFIFAFEAGIISKLLGNKLFVLLGAVSYSVYMLQAFAVFGFAALLPRILPGHEAVVGGRDVWGNTLLEGDVVVIAYLFVVVAAAVITYYLVEMPGRDFFRKIVRGAEGKIIE